MVQFAIDMYSQILVIALPVAVVFELGNLFVGTVLRAAFGGRLRFGK